MFTFRKRKSTGLLALVLAGVAAFGAHAFTASNTVPDHSAGSGAAAASGYTISNYAYTFSADGTTINVVAFDLDKAASDVKIALTATPVHADWLDCAGSAGGSNTVTCTLGTPVAASAVNDLHVVTVSTGTATIA